MPEKRTLIPPRTARQRKQRRVARSGVDSPRVIPYLLIRTAATCNGARLRESARQFRNQSHVIGPKRLGLGLAHQWQLASRADAECIHRCAGAWLDTTTRPKFGPSLPFLEQSVGDGDS